MTDQHDSLSRGLYQCPACYGPSDGPGECAACLTRPRDYSQYTEQHLTLEQVQAHLMRTYGSSSPVEITEREFPLRPPNPYTRAFLNDTETMPRCGEMSGSERARWRRRFSDAVAD